MRRLIVGAGAVGTALADLLIERGETVRIASTSGRTVTGTESLRLDASDATALTAAAAGCRTIFLLVNPPYTTWPETLPPIVDAAIEAARRTGADLVMGGNLYAYGPVDGAMTEQSPLASTEAKGMLRAELWRRAQAATLRGDVRAVEVRSSDYYGPTAGANSHLGTKFFGPIVASETARVTGDPLMPHSWSYIPDFAATLAAAADDDRSWGRAWHVPSGEPRTMRDIAAEANLVAGSSGDLERVSPTLVALAKLVSPFLREVEAVRYEFERPYVLDASETEGALQLRPTPWRDALDATVEANLRARRGALR